MKFLLLLLLPLSLFAAEPATSPSASAPKLQQWLIILRPAPAYQTEKAWTEKETAIVGRHFQRLQAAAAKGEVLLAGKTSEPLDKTLGLVVFEAPDEAAARAFLAEDPCVAAGIMTGEVRPYAVALMKKP